jgi:adenylate kinase
MGAMRVVLVGPPGVGKGTQAARLRREIGVPHVSTGDILRDAVQKGTPLGRRARSYMESGKLVPDDLMGEMIAERLGQPDAAQGFVLDGFPRTEEQVRILDAVLTKIGARLDSVLALTAPAAEIVRRLAGRRVCPKCGSVYHIENHPPASPGVCDGCASALVQRPDDEERVIRERLRVYEAQTLPLLALYRERGLLKEVDGAGDADVVFAGLRSALAAS